MADSEQAANGRGASNGTGDDNTQYVSISQEVRGRWLNYAVSVITSRALPDVRDGLKPVQRRILYSMFSELRVLSDAKYVKSARITGDTMGKFHPHGDSSIYDAMVRMAQDFTYRHTLIDGWGNFGSIIVPRPAAARYTEARLRPLAEELMNELRFETIDMRPNYDASMEEPVVLPARFPHLLVNGGTGIAVGMATSIPPHNLAEVIKACILLINEPDASVARLAQIIKGPDFPLGGRIVSDRKDLKTMYEEGKGSVKVRAEWRFDVEKRKEIPTRLVIHSVPYAIDVAGVISDIGQIVASRKLPQLLEVSDQTDAKSGLRIVLELKPGSSPDSVMSYLYKHTALEQNFAYNATCLVPEPGGATVPRRLSLVELLKEFLQFRFITVKRRFEYLLRQVLRRIHILEGFEIIFSGLDKALKIIRSSSGKQDANTKLRAAFPLDEEQANAILELQLYRISQLEIDDILKELAEKRAEAARIKKTLASNKLLWNVVETELGEVAEKYGDKRRTALGSSEDIAEFNPQAYIVRENTNVVTTRDGWVKRVGRLTTVESTRVRDGDEVLSVSPASTLSAVAFFSSEGIAYTLPVNELPVSSGYGDPLSKYCRLGDGALIVNALTLDERFTPPDRNEKGEDVLGPYLFVATARGQVLRVPLGPFRTASTKAGRKYCRLRPGDKVVFVQLVDGETTVLLASKAARVLHFKVKEVPVLSGVGKGVRGIKIPAEDQVLGAALLTDPRDSLRVITSSDKEVVFTQQKYEPTSRGGKGVRTTQRLTFTKVLRPDIQLVDWATLEDA